MRHVIRYMSLSGFLIATIAIDSAWAHHSHAMYESDVVVPVTGVVTAIRWANPHSWVTVDAPDAGGNMVSYQIELAGIQQMRGRSITPETLKVGDRITISIQPLRSGDPGGAYVGIKAINNVENTDTGPGWKPKTP